MRTCTKCKQTKSISEFGKKASRKDGIHPWCRTCARRESRGFYQRNPDPYKRRAKTSRRQRSDKLRTQAELIRGDVGCQCCGEKLTCVLDFHHLHGNAKGKDDGMPVSRAAHKSRAAFLRELEKCVVVCANCHRKIHAGYITLSDTIETADAAYQRLFGQTPA